MKARDAADHVAPKVGYEGRTSVLRYASQFKGTAGFVLAAASAILKSRLHELPEETWHIAAKQADAYTIIRACYACQYAASEIGQPFAMFIRSREGQAIFWEQIVKGG